MFPDRRCLLHNKYSLWNSFASVKLTIVLLFTLAATSILGTVIPQQKDPEAYLRQYGEGVYRLLDFLNILDMYHSWWFQLLLLLLVANLVVCSLQRLSSTWKLVFTREPSFRPDRFRNLKNKQEFKDKRSADELLRVFQPHVQSSFPRTHLQDQDGSRYLFGEKHRWSRLGVYVVHLSVLLMLIGGLIGSLLGFKGFTTIPEGESVTRIRSQNTDEVIDLGFELKCEDFEVSFYDSGQPKEFRSDLVVLKQGKPVYEKSIRVNQPLRYQGISIYQSTYGRVPPEHSGQSAPEEIDLLLHHQASGKEYSLTTRIGEKNELPAGLGTLTLVDYKANFHLKGMELGPSLLARHSRPEKEPVYLLLPLNYPNFDKMRQAGVYFTVKKTRGGHVPEAPVEPVYYTGLQIKKDPGVWVVYSGFILLIIGCFITFFLSHQRVCVAVIQDEGKSRVVVSGLADRNKLAMDRKVEQLSRALPNL
ncbi:MAG: cytochrome c biogenesis protein ResB [Desulfohalobiaceae bacterium]|nr:cytochrome c biogenesis protein ResB [Desulfohalobiaceae bacterium]